LALFTGYLGGHLSFARGVSIGDRGLAQTDTPGPATPDDRSGTPDELLAAAEASTVIGVPAQQIDIMVEQGLLHPVPTPTGQRFRRSEALAVRDLGG
jgi:hypothetical protein